MAYESQVMRAAVERLAQRRQQHEGELQLRRQQVYQRLPRVQVIDQQLRKTVMLAAATALRTGEDPTAAINAIRDKNLALQQERQELLRRSGYPADYLEEKPLCPRCKDSGWVGAQMCGCLKALCTEEQNKLLSSMLDLRGQSFETFRLDYYGSSYSMERQNMERIFNLCREYANHFPDMPLRNLLMSGPPGVGKTFLSACIARVISGRGYSVVYDTAINIFTQFEAEKFTRDPDAQHNTRRYLTCDLLILDDLGSEMTTPFVQAALYHLVNSRLIANKRTVISTNLHIGEIGGRYSLQSASRLTGEYQLLEFRGSDIRQKKGHM